MPIYAKEIRSSKSIYDLLKSGIASEQVRSLGCGLSKKADIQSFKDVLHNELETRDGIIWSSWGMYNSPKLFKTANECFYGSSSVSYRTEYQEFEINVVEQLSKEKCATKAISMVKVLGMQYDAIMEDLGSKSDASAPLGALNTITLFHVENKPAILESVYFYHKYGSEGKLVLEDDALEEFKAKVDNMYGSVFRLAHKLAEYVGLDYKYIDIAGELEDVPLCNNIEGADTSKVAKEGACLLVKFYTAQEGAHDFSAIQCIGRSAFSAKEECGDWDSYGEVTQPFYILAEDIGFLAYE